MDVPPRSIIRTAEFDEQLLALIPSAPAADEFINAAEEALSHDPEIGALLSEKFGLWGLAMAPIGNRSVTLLYSFDDHTVVFESIFAIDD